MIDLSLPYRLERAEYHGASTDAFTVFCKKTKDTNTFIANTFVSENVSRCLPGEQKSKWFSLPGEVRNQIYDYIFSEHHEYEIKYINKSESRTHLTYASYLEPRENLRRDIVWGACPTDDPTYDDIFRGPNLSSRVINRRRALAYPRHRLGWPDLSPVSLPGPAAFIQTSRQIYAETAGLFYDSCTFSFKSVALLSQFVGKLGPIPRTAIRRVWLAHQTYNHSRLPEYASRRERNNALWEKRLGGLSTCLPGKFLSYFFPSSSLLFISHLLIAVRNRSPRVQPPG